MLAASAVPPKVTPSAFAYTTSYTSPASPEKKKMPTNQPRPRNSAGSRPAGTKAAGAHGDAACRSRASSVSASRQTPRTCSPTSTRPTATLHTENTCTKPRWSCNHTGAKRSKAIQSTKLAPAAHCNAWAQRGAWRQRGGCINHSPSAAANGRATTKSIR